MIHFQLSMFSNWGNLSIRIHSIIFLLVIENFETDSKFLDPIWRSRSEGRLDIVNSVKSVNIRSPICMYANFGLLVIWNVLVVSGSLLPDPPGI